MPTEVRRTTQAQVPIKCVSKPQSLSAGLGHCVQIGLVKAKEFNPDTQVHGE